MQFSPTKIFVYGAIWTALWGAIVWLSKDKISTHRERKSRKQHFLAHLSAWQSEVAYAMGIVVVMPDIPGTVVHRTVDKMALEFNAKLSPFIEKATILELNYRRETLLTFQGLVRKITQMTIGQIDTKQGKKELLGALRDLSDFVRKH